ncbi:hypothetical protein GYB22_06975 [bacterium]|nr:hypothetical protein [bacterium]
MKSLLSILLLLFSLAASAQQDSASSVKKKGTRIEILQANELVYDREIGKYQRCIGNVKFKQDQVLMDCDSAWFYEDQNRIEAFGSIYIRQRDSFNLWGEHLDYDGDTRMAVVEKNVRLTDNKMTLRTERLDYNLNSKTAYYTVGGNIENGEDKLYSKVGTYYSRSKEFHFKKDVKLTNPEYTMTSDTLKYNTVSKTAYFHGPTYIVSEENTIFCNYGWYDTERDISQFSKRAYIQGDENKLEADSMIYNRNTGYGEAFRNLRLTDTTENIVITGQYGNYQRFIKRTLITGSPMAMKEMDEDSFFLRADTMIDQTDTATDARALTSYRKVRIYKSDMQAIADSMIYNFTDSAIRLFQNPILWTDSNQITGDTIYVFRNNEGIEKLLAFENGFMIEKDVHGFYNQVSGKKITGFFEEGKLHHILVSGNGHSVYYAQEDSATYSGVNDVICGSMVIYMDSVSGVETIIFRGQPTSDFYPLNQFPVSKRKLPGFNWQSGIKPKRAEFVSF